MEKLYRFYADYGRLGAIEGVFVADEAEVAAALGCTVSFCEPWGKHSSAKCTLAASHFTILTDDQDFIAKARKYGIVRFGENPLGILADMRHDGLV
jgi:hypothetical protein